MAALKLRIDLDPDMRIGPGKIELLERIAATNSISVASRTMGMSYKRAWDLVDEMNRMFKEDVVARQIGGRNGGGATLTPFGADLVWRFRFIERAAQGAVASQLAALQAAIAPSA